jgi:DNA-binding NarL/FixJ family response regulator
MKNRPAHIFIVEPHPLMRDAAASLINREEDLEICGQSGDYEEALESSRLLTADLVVLEIAIHDDDGIDLMVDLKEKRAFLKFLICSAQREPFHVLKAYRNGAHGYVIKDYPSHRLIDGIRQVLQGNLFFQDAITEQFLREIPKELRKEIDALRKKTG